YYGSSAPLRDRQPTVDLPVTVPAGRWEGRSRNGSHVHCVPVDGGGAQLFPGSLATGTPQAFPNGLPTDGLSRLRSRRPGIGPDDVHCCPTHIHQV
ncbi:MAG: hypothetical protein J2P17_22085, partial [Mycobacterium sp.]|nr:hypothetical protein [Mycobacterium sp.]